MAELIWDGKYDEHGNKRAPVRIELPFQTVESVNESVQERQRTLELSSSGHDPEWRNRLIWGDKKYVLPSLLPEFAGKVDLIYIDPPFDTGADFSFSATIPAHSEHEEEASFTKEPSVLEQKAYRDTWGRGLDSYLQWIHEAVVLFHELLHDTGSIYVHLDYNVGHYAKAVLDEVFGPENFRNEITWQRTTSRKGVNQLGRVHDDIYFYTKNANATWNPPSVSQNAESARGHDFLTDPDGVIYRLSDLTGAGKGPARLFNGVRKEPPTGRHWAYDQPGIDDLMARGRIAFSQGGNPRLKTPLADLKGVAVHDVWVDIPALNSAAEERVNYPTQKPEAVLERIIAASTSPDDLIFDCFVGSGTTAAVAEKLNRRWIACDLGRFAIHTTRKRLLGINGVKPFIVQNLGKYERQQWQVAEFAPSSSTVILSEAKDPVSADTRKQLGREFSRDRGENAPRGRSSRQADAGSPSASSGQAFDSVAVRSAPGNSAQDDRLREQRERETAYRKFILELYHATPVSGHVWLHGVKGGRMVHVAAVDAPVTRADVNAIAAEVWRAAGKGPNSPQKPAVDVLGWEFALDMNETAKQVAAEARVDAAFKRIPREVLEKKAVEQGDVYFFELGALSVETKIKKRELTLTLSDFVIPSDDVPAEVRSAIKHWSQMVDYWAVDWDFKDDTFHNQWQSYRTRKDPKLELAKEHEYAEPGKYTVVVKVIDILGNDTTKTLTVEIK